VEVEVVPWAATYGDAFARLNLEWIERYFAVEPADVQVLGDPEQSILAAGGAIFYAVRGVVVLGTVALLPPANGVMELAKMAVSPSAHGMGIGRRLLERAIRHARALGMRELSQGSARGRRMYTSPRA
jgi:GNAT superfamily N-acetyltransferase